MEFETCLKKQKDIQELFKSCLNSQDVYEQIIALGKQLKKLDAAKKLPENLVTGCQSTTYLSSCYKDGVMEFEGESDALISCGLLALLIRVYSEETPETILKCPPTFIDQLGLSASLSPNRANGLFSMHLRMKQEALKRLMDKKEK